MTVVGGPPCRCTICPPGGERSLQPLLRAFAKEGVSLRPPSREGSGRRMPAPLKGGPRTLSAGGGVDGGQSGENGSWGGWPIELAVLLWPPSFGPGALRFMVDSLRSLSRPLRAGRGAVVLVYPGDVPPGSEGRWQGGVVEALGRSLVRSFALEYAPDARVNFVVGGPHLARREGRHARLPTRRNTTSEDLVQAALFLGGDGARFITGETLPVDGGAHLLWTAGGEG